MSVGTTLIAATTANALTLEAQPTQDYYVTANKGGSAKTVKKVRSVFYFSELLLWIVEQTTIILLL